MKSKMALAAVVISALSVGGPAQAAYEKFFGETLNGQDTPLTETQIRNGDAFLAYTTFLGKNNGSVADFEGTLPPPSSNGSLTLGFGSGNRAVNATLAGGTGSVVTGPVEGRYSVIGGDKYWSVAVAGTAPMPFTLMFDAKVEAFGFFGVDIGDFGGSLKIELLDDLGRVMATPAGITDIISTGGPNDPPQDSRNGAVLYYGISASTSGEWFRGIRFVQQVPGNLLDAFGFDSFTVVGAPGPTPPGVPEPASLALVGAALLGLVASRRRF